jgi:hypothetical protein
MDVLIDDYSRILKKINIEAFDLDKDKYSGVFLPVPFDEYWKSEVKIMLVGRETAGWNTNNKKNTIKRVVDFAEDNNMDELVYEAVSRYKNHLPLDQNGKVITKSRSRFKQYYFRLAKELRVNPKSIIYANLFAWDYDKKTPRLRPESELDEITTISQRLLASQITHLKPDFVIFSAGFSGVDSVIKGLFNKYFDGYENSAQVIPRKLWEFKAADATCFRIAHPRATYGHGEFRDMVIQRIKDRLACQSDNQVNGGVG